jgi:low temperature requirement protein LtrA
MVAGVIVAAAGYELAIAHPRSQTHAATACLVLGGPALFLVGEMLFKWTVWRHVPPTRVVPIGMLVALIPVAFVSSVLLLLSLATAAVVAAAWLSSRAHVAGLSSLQVSSAASAAPRGRAR